MKNNTKANFLLIGWCLMWLLYKILTPVINFHNRLTDKLNELDNKMFKLKTNYQDVKIIKND